MTKQLTLGELLAALDAMEQSLPVHMAGFGLATSPFGFGRHRTHADGLAIHVFHDRSGTWTVGRLATRLRKRLSPKPRGEYVATLDTPVWAQPATQLQFNAITGVEVLKGRAVIRSRNVAPAYGPTLQRVPDEEALDRMRAAEELRSGQARTGEPAKTERWLLRCLPAERTATLLRVAEARHELAQYESRLAELKENVVTAEATAAEIDYILGITETLPGAKGA